MKRTRIVLVALAATCIIILFSLPKVVVDNDKVEVSSQPAKQISTAGAPTIDSLTLSRIAYLTESLQQPDNTGKNTIFADSLASLYAGLLLWDSAAMYRQVIAEAEPTPENLLKAGEAFFEAQSITTDASKAEEYGQQARSYFERRSQNAADSLDMTVRIGLTYVSSTNPMQGILMIRNVLQQDPENELALYTLGVLSMQSGQFDNAITRFSQLLEVNPDNLSVYFHLGVSYLEAGDKEKAKEQFETVKTRSEDPEVIANADAYLQEIN